MVGLRPFNRRNSQSGDAFEQIQLNYLINDILDELDESNYSQQFGNRRGNKDVFTDILQKRPYRDYDRGNGNQDNLVDIVLATLLSQNAGFSNRRGNSVIREIFGRQNRRGGSDSDDVLDQLQECIECLGDTNDFSQGRNSSHILERVVSHLANSRGNWGGCQDDDDILPILVQQLVGRQNQQRHRRFGGNTGFDGRWGNRQNDVVYLLLDSLIRNIDRNDHRSGRFELDLLDHLLNNRNRRSNVDLYDVVQRLFDGYDSDVRGRFGEHDIVRSLLRHIRQNRGNRTRFSDDYDQNDFFRNRNSDVIQILREWFRDQEDEPERLYRDQRFRDFLGRASFDSYGPRQGNRGIRQRIQQLVQGQRQGGRRGYGGNNVEDILDILQQETGYQKGFGRQFSGSGQRDVDVIAEIADILDEQNDIQPFGHSRGQWFGKSNFGGRQGFNVNPFERFRRNRFDDYSNSAESSGVFGRLNNQWRF